MNKNVDLDLVPTRAWNDGQYQFVKLSDQSELARLIL